MLRRGIFILYVAWGWSAELQARGPCELFNKFLRQHDIYKSISPSQRQFLEEFLEPITGKRLYQNGFRDARHCSVGGCEIRLPLFPDSPDVRLVWEAATEGFSKPIIVEEGGVRKLKIPMDYDFDRLDSLGREEQMDQIVRFLVGHALHPYTAVPENYPAHLKPAVERKALGESPIVMKNGQEEGILAAMEAAERGDKSFLFVAPTGLGKSEVIKEFLSSRLAARDVPPLHVMVVDQTGPVNQLARDVARLREESPQLDVLHLKWTEDDQGADVAAGPKKRGRLTLEEKARRESLGQTSKTDRTVDRLIEQVREAQAKGQKVVLTSTIQTFKSQLAKASPEKVAELRQLLGTFIFDEAHHSGAPQARAVVDELIYHPDSKAFFFGTTATPMHSEVSLVDKLFQGKAFWAGLDTAQAYLQHGGKLERSIEDIVSQLTNSIQKGELSPLNRIEMVDPKELAGRVRDDIFVRSGDERSPWMLNPSAYRETLREFAPQFTRHKKGFLATDNTKEADNVAQELSRQHPDKKFAAFHSNMPKEDLVEIQRKFKAGEINFLVTVRKLDEAMNFPDMTLYVDLNFGTGPRQLLQRMGRVLRLHLNKSGAEIASFFKVDHDEIRDKLVILDNLIAGRFSGDAKDLTLAQMHQQQQKYKSIREKLTALNPKKAKALPAPEASPTGVTPRALSFADESTPEFAERINRFVVKNFEAMYDVRLPNPEYPGLAPEDVVYEQALATQLALVRTDPAFRAHASVDVLTLLDGPPAHETASAEQTSPPFPSRELSPLEKRSRRRYEQKEDKRSAMARDSGAREARLAQWQKGEQAWKKYQTVIAQWPLTKAEKDLIKKNVRFVGSAAEDFRKLSVESKARLMKELFLRITKVTNTVGQYADWSMSSGQFKVYSYQSNIDGKTQRVFFDFKNEKAHVFMIAPKGQREQDLMRYQRDFHYGAKP